MDTIIFFDLEETLIEEWPIAHLMTERIPGLRPWIARQQPFRAGLLSFAVWDDADVQRFNASMRPFLEEQFSFVFEDDLILTKTALLHKTRIWDRMPLLSMDDFDDFFNKRRSMEDLWLHEFQRPDTHVILLDDTIPDLTITSHLPNCRLSLVNSKNLPCP